VTTPISSQWPVVVSLPFDRSTRRPAIAYYGRAVANELGGKLKQAYLDYREASRIDPILALRYE